MSAEQNRAKHEFAFRTEQFPREERDAQYQALWERWVELSETIEGRIGLRAHEIFTQLKQAACMELERSAACFARLGTSDEDIYNSLSDLMDVYQHVVELGSGITLADPAIDALLAGICEVLSARLREFSEVSPDGVENPVTREKREIVDRAALHAGTHISDMGGTFTKWLQTERPADWRKLCAGMLNPPEVTIEDIVVRDCMPQIYNNFQEVLRFCLAKLDDLHARKTAGFYTALMEREWEELGNIIKVQVMALELAASGAPEVTDPDDPAGTDELPMVYRILNMLREVYQQTGPAINALQKLLHSPPVRPGIAYDEFAQRITDAFHLSEPEEIPSGSFFDALSEEVIALFNYRDEFAKIAHQTQQMLNDEKLLAEEISRAFVTVKKTLAEFTFVGHCELDSQDMKLQYDILTGIAETIGIKIESLQDSIQSFDEEGLDLLRNFSEEKINLSDEELQRARDIARVTWLDTQDIALFFTEILASEPFTIFQARINKQIASLLEKFEKLTFRFKKEVVLYEICTYEEILAHSVSRLRNSEWAEMADVAAMLDGSYTGLEILLKQNDIIAIRPAPHDPFNAFEHDVLVAEKQDDFNKGEIIKMISTGYKQNDKVLLRANVIAAR